MPRLNSTRHLLNTPAHTPEDAITAPTALSRHSGATGKRRPAEYGDHGTTTLVYPRHRRPATSRPLTHPFTINLFTNIITQVYTGSQQQSCASGLPARRPPPPRRHRYTRGSSRFRSLSSRTIPCPLAQIFGTLFPSVRSLPNRRHALTSSRRSPT